MRYSWIGTTIVIIWALAAYIIWIRPDVNTTVILMTSVIGSLFLGIWGFKPPK